MKQSLKQAAKKGDKDVCLILAKEIVNARKAVNRINASKAQLNSVALHMNQQAANLRVAGVMDKSADVMKAMHSLVRVHEISEVMRDLSKEMTKAGIMEEMMEETMESTSGMDEEELEDEVQKEVDKVLFDLTEGELWFASAFRPRPLPHRRLTVTNTSQPSIAAFLLLAQNTCFSWIIHRFARSLIALPSCCHICDSLTDSSLRLAHRSTGSRTCCAA